MSVKDAQQLKQLQSRLSKAQGELSVLQGTLADTKTEVTAKHELINRLKQDIAKLNDKSKGGLIVTEHALLQFMVRAMQIDLDWIADQILTDELLQMHGSLGNGKYPIGNDLKAVIRDGKVLTVTPS